MKLRSLRIQGFKSFADSTTIDFHEGVTAIVGPNGCGKSNISDAIRWVLGEQRPSMIRGAKMEEAIFQGTVNRRPVNRGSVTLTVGNEDGILPVPFEEVEIGRTVYRDGGSDYVLNRSSCRLRDVVDLCRDTGLGANAYSIIENRMIDSILSDRAEERRALFEEASGIGKYKDRRKSALRRLQHAETDLQRLEDVIAEVETKVRSLARQKGKAERYKMLRQRRLFVEVAVVRNTLSELRARLGELDREWSGGKETGAGMTAVLTAAESEQETLALGRVTAEKARTHAATALENIRSRLVTWERDLAVAEERRSYAGRRLEQITTERSEAHERAEEVETELTALAAKLMECEGECAGLKQDLTEKQAEAVAVQARVADARQTVEAAENKERELLRAAARLEGDADASESQAAELERRIERIVGELSDASNTLSEIQSQGDLFSDRLSALESDVEAAREAFGRASATLSEIRETLADARETEARATMAEQRIAVELEALRGLDDREEGGEAVLSAAMELGVAGVLGPLAEYIEAPPEVARAVERLLGPLADGLVVQSTAVALRLVAWFGEEWHGGGGLVLLPLDEVPAPSSAGGALLESITVDGAGAPWVNALLAGVGFLGGGDGSFAGGLVDPRGVVQVGSPFGGSGTLERKERIRVLTAEQPGVDRAAEAARQATRDARAAVERAEQGLQASRVTFQAAEDGFREASSEAAAQVDRQARMDLHRDELTRQLEGTKAARTGLLQRAMSARDDRTLMLAEEGEVREQREAARRAHSDVQEEWETARAEETRLGVEFARAEAEVGRMTERSERFRLEKASTSGRIAALDEEEAALAKDLDEAERVRVEGGDATQRLFGEREQAETLLREKDEELAEVIAKLTETERRVRTARSAEREATERRHRLELERQEVSSRVSLIQERLEAEWGRPLERLLDEAEPVEGEPEELEAELTEIVGKMERIGLVNMLAVEEHAEESERLGFLTEQRADLVQARNDLGAAIKQINETAIALFEDTFQKIRDNFQLTFRRLFEGGEADLWLADTSDPLESPIEIHASPKGKRTQRIDLLSGGERALTALSLLFGIYLVKPSPFCVLDEVDAPLDENNIGRFIRLLGEFKAQTQFVVITHNPRTIESADWIYGVTMEEAGVSSVVGVRLREDAKASGSAA
ncbi:MAG: chromosome segregation protein SMC [Gemmatimonadota bacterium]|nr:MAG: chromosome segregation protein SMC [Gemmatimonadota bacterium]